MNSKLRNVVALVAVSLMLAFCMTAMGQVLKSGIRGTVTDTQGAVVAGADVKATEIATNVTRSTTTDGSGEFHFNLISPGTYKIEASFKGFKTSVQTGILASAGSDVTVGAIKLSAGGITETVDVTSDAALIETTTPQVTSTFSGATLSTFAGLQENQGLDSLALFVPGVVAARDNGFSNTNGGSGFSVNGLRGRNNDQQIDGQNNNDNSVGGPGLFVSDTEFVQQYVLITNNFGPEYGRNAGSVVNVITKSGTNAWHGSIYATENASSMNAMSNQEKRFLVNPDGTSLKEPQHLNDEFGGFTIGGPWVKNKLFFFGGFDQEIVNLLANYHSDSLSPTPAGLAKLNGCYPGSKSLQAWNKFGPYGIGGAVPVPVPVNPSTASGPREFPLIDINAVATTGLDCDNVQFGGVSRILKAPVHNFNFVNRLDWQLGSDTITGRYLFNRGNFFNQDFGDGAAGYPVNVPALSQAILMSWTHNLSSHMVNEARISFNRLNVVFGGNTLGTVPTDIGLTTAVAKMSFRFAGADLEFPGSAQADGAIPEIGFLALGPATNLPQGRVVNTWQAQDNWNYVKGKHTFKAGINWTYQRSPNSFLPAVNGSFQFDTWSDAGAFFGTGTTPSGFIPNAPDRVQVAQGPSTLDFREYDTFLYGGDDWKIRQNLTLNLGITWSYYGQPANLFNEITTKQQNSSDPFWKKTLPASITSTPTFPAPKNSFGPSLGFAYSPQWGGFLTGHGKTTIRGGYRFLYDPPFYNIYLNQATSAPQVFLQTFTGGSRAPSSPDSTTLPLPVTPTGPNVRSSLGAFLQHGVFDPRSFADTGLSPDFGPDKVHSYTLGVARELSKNSAIEARYAGNRAYDLFQSVNANPFIGNLAADFPQFTQGLTPCAVGQVEAGPGQLSSSKALGRGRVNCGEGVIRNRENTGYSRYNALQVEFRASNLFKQLLVKSSYTWSKNLDNVSEIFSTFGGGNTVAFSQNPLELKKGEYSFSGLDIPHQWTILFTEQVPFFKDQKGLAGHLFGGWAFSGNYILASGQRYTPSQVFIAQVSQPKDYFDSGFFGAFNGGVETARPFMGNPNAPISSVGIFCKDAHAAFGVSCVGPGLSNTTLISMNAINTQAPGAAPVIVTTNDVHWIANGGQAEAIFGTPFGNVPRNAAQDAISNIGNFEVIKRFKISEKTGFEFHATMINVFNHFNFSSVDPFLEDAGLGLSFTGFGDNTTTGGNGRRIFIGGKFNF
jgi:hypothetical protein